MNEPFYYATLVRFDFFVQRDAKGFVSPRDFLWSTMRDIVLGCHPLYHSLTAAKQLVELGIPHWYGIEELIGTPLSRRQFHAFVGFADKDSAALASMILPGIFQKTWDEFSTSGYPS